ncbi:MAG: HD domain-containing protein [Bacteroidetes bacterium]|nr:HD domain-containing protein [Bacteroidota bacterium]
METVLQHTAAFVQQYFENEPTGHDWWHIKRVWNTSKTIAEIEGANLFVCEMAALLHDLDDWKVSEDGDETPIKANNWMKEQGLDNEMIETIASIITQLSFKGLGVDTTMPTLEGKVVQDADRLDALGAIGIARAFAFGGNRKRLLYHPDIPPKKHQSSHEYKKDEGHTINHFYEKLLYLKDRMQTATGLKLAAERHVFMEVYLEQFYKEWNASL